MKLVEPIELSRSAAPGMTLPAVPFVRRRLSPAAGRALELLGHAIEYLADEYAANVENLALLGSADPRVEAIQILKSLNRAVYYSGTEVPTTLHRLRHWCRKVGWPPSRV